MVAETEKTFGSLDILVNNAGIQFIADDRGFSCRRWDAIIAINLSGVFHGMKAAIPGMKQRGWGRIINIASAHGLVASPQKVAYVAAKHGVVGHDQGGRDRTGQSRRHGERDLPRLGADAAGAEAARGQGEAGRHRRRDAEARFLTEKQPMAEFSTPEQIGALAVFLCSERREDHHRRAAVDRWRLGGAMSRRAV